MDDIRNIAKKIIPDQIAEDLTDKLQERISNYRHVNDPHDELQEYDPSDYDGTDDYDGETESAEESNPDAPTKYANLKAKDYRNPKKGYQISSQDLDELVKRVKEKLGVEFQIASKVKTDDKTTTERNKRIEDYYYKDDTLNEHFSKNEPDEIQNIPANPTVTIKKPKYVADYEEVDVRLDGEENTDITIPKYNKGRWKEVKQENIRDHNEETTRNYYEPHVIDNSDEKANYAFKEKRPEYIDDSYHKKVTRYNEREHNTTPDVNYEDDKKYAENGKVEDLDTFKKIDMRNTNDSYEDYVTPKREDVFESAEATEGYLEPKNSLRNEQKFALTNQENNLKSAVNVNYESVMSNVKKVDFDTSPHLAIPMRSPRPREVKAKTANMWFKEPDILNYDDSIKKTKENADETTKKHKLNTMFPTKSHIKFSSPNYFAKLPAVAEKYNFNEPIPENDRGPENLKYIGNPESSVNKKVRL